MTIVANSDIARRAVRAVAGAVAMAALCLSPAWARGGFWGGPQHSTPHPSAPHSAPAPRASAPRQPRGGNVPHAPGVGQGQQSDPQQPGGNPYSGATSVRPAYPTANQGYPSYPAVRPAYPGANGSAYRSPYANPNTAPPGHLQSWLNDHRNTPVRNQEEILRNDPGFRRLPAGEQQRLIQQLHNVNGMGEAERQRRLARNEMLERLSPQDRMRVNQSAQAWRALPADRQAIMRNAFHDLRAVPPDQRSTVLNSARYQNQFNPQERGILSDVLRAEPYTPQ